MRGWAGSMGRVERTWARHLVPEGRVPVPQAPEMGALPWATGTDTWASHEGAG